MSLYNEMDDIITKYLCGEASPEEALMLEDWRNTSTFNNEYFISMQKTIQIIENTSTPNINSDNALIQVKRSIRNKQLKIYGILFLVMVVLLTLGSWYYVQQNKTKTIEAVQYVINKTLPDATIVNLEKKSKIVLDDAYNKSNRKIKLSGSATFKVVHNDQKPFIIETDQVFIEDLGTEFTITNHPDSDTIFVVVNEGIVRLYDRLGSEIIIKAGEKAWYVKSKKLIITDSGARIIKFNFNNTRLEEVVKIISDTYGEPIKLSPQQIGNCSITTQFFDEDLPTIITIITETLDFKYEYQNGHYSINGKPCQ